MSQPLPGVSLCYGTGARPRAQPCHSGAFIPGQQSPKWGPRQQCLRHLETY